MNGQGHPKCELNDSSYCQPDNAGNVSECHSVYPVIALLGISSESPTSRKGTNRTVTATRARSAQMVQANILNQAVLSHLQHGV